MSLVDVLGLILVLSLGGYMFYAMFVKKITLEGMLTDDLSNTLKAIAVVCTIGEVIRLSFEAIKLERMDWFGAFFAYGMMGLMETLAAFAMFFSIQKGFMIATDPNSPKGSKISLIEGAKIYFKGFLWWCASIIFTFVILYFYLESMNHIELKSSNSVFPYYLETNPDRFSESVGEQLRLNLPNLVVILLTPLLNFIIAISIYKNVVTFRKANPTHTLFPPAKGTPSTPTTPTPAPTTPITPAVPATPATPSTPSAPPTPPTPPTPVTPITLPGSNLFLALEQCFGLANAKMEFENYVGYNSTGDIIAASTNADIKSGAKARKDLVKELDDTIVRPYLIPFVSCKNDVTNKVADLNTKVNNVKPNLNPASISSMRTTDKNILKNALNVIKRDVASLTQAVTDGDKHARDIVNNMAIHGFSLSYNDYLKNESKGIITVITSLNIDNVINSL